MKRLSVFFTVFLSLNGFAQQFQLETIMQGEAFIGYSPVRPAWSADGQLLYFDWNPNNEPGNSLYAYSLKTGTYTLVPKRHPEMPAVIAENTGFIVQYFNDAGNLVRYDAKTGKLTTLFSGGSSVRNIQHVANPQQVCFQLNNDLYLYDGTNGSWKQLTRFVQGSAPVKSTDTSVLAKQQQELFLAVRKDKERKEWEEQNRFERTAPSAVYYGKDESLENLAISSNGRFVTFRLSIYPEDPLTYFDEHITASGYTNRIAARAKVSDNDTKHRMGIYDSVEDTAYYVSFASLSGIRKRAAYFNEYGQTADFEKDRSILMHPPIMHPDGKTGLLEIRSYDNKDRWIVLLDFPSGTFTELEHQHDEAWIGGPGISEWNEEPGTLGWIDANTCYFQSESTGYSHLYTLDIRTKTKTALTSGNVEIHDVILSKDKQTFYLIANKIHPGVRNGYRLSLRDKQLVPLFEGNFGIEWKLSPDEKTWAIRYSTATEPWDLFIATNKPGAQRIRVTKSVQPAFAKLSLMQPEVVQIPASDGKEVTARLYRPKNANGAAVLFVHGAGYLQNAHYYWSTYFREFLFHQLLAEKGYTVLDIDYRASEGYGRDVRTAIYRHMGERDLQDYIDGKKFLVERYGIDSNRVGIYGGSYGGFITLMAMMKTPGTFACGAALRSVTDWLHYNHEYTSNILNYPSSDPLAYRRSSPIYYAEGLKGPLLILHGMEDDNVQFQDVVRLNQRLIELGKTNYSMAVFPTEPHGFKSAVAWTDEYRRILELFETHLQP